MLKPENTVFLVVDFQERLMPAINGSDEILRRSAAFIKGMKLLDVPIIVTQQYTKGLGPTVPQISEALGEFEPVEKVTFSCKANKEFCKIADEFLDVNIVVIGAEAHICVQQTVIDFLDDLYTVYLVCDCIGSRNEMDKEYAIWRMRDSGAIITTFESVLFELLHTADHPKRKEIQALITNL